MKSLHIGSVTIEWLGHAGFILRAEENVVYIDPYKVPLYIGYEDQADVLLITHEHFDHCSPDSIPKVRKSTATTLVPESCGLEFRGDARRVEAGDVLHDELSIKGLNIDIVPAYNIGKPNHPKGMGVGYVVEIGGKRIYHAGDTDLIDEMKEINADVVLLPVAGYGMDEAAAAEAVSLINPEIAIPMHYGSLEGMDADIDLFISLVKQKAPDVEVVILEIRDIRCIMSRSRKQQKRLIKEVAMQRIRRLFELAEQEYATHPERSFRYASLARRMGMRHRVRLPRELRQKVCRSCDSYLVPGSTSRVRLQKNNVCITCLKCGRTMRYPYKR